MAKGLCVLFYCQTDGRQERPELQGRAGQMSKSKLITAASVREMLEANEAVKAGSAENTQMMSELSEQVVKKFVYVVSAGKCVLNEALGDF